MQQMGTFIVGHWELFGALAIILFLLARTWTGPGAISMLMPTEAIQMINHKDALVVDVRTDKEYQSGHVMNAMHIPLGTLEDRVADLQAYKDSAVVLVCRSGARSGQGAGKLRKLGFSDVHNLGGGMMAWERANLPVTTKAGVPPKPGKVSVDNNGDADNGDADSEKTSQVVVYSTRKCPFCVRAVKLLESKGVGFTEIRIDKQPEKRKEMEKRTQRTSVPQIFIGDHHVGGCDELYASEEQGKLDALLGLVVEEASPSGGKEASPSAGKEASPSGDKETSPSSNKEASPSAGKEASPSGDKETSPTSDEKTSPSSNIEPSSVTKDEAASSSNAETAGNPPSATGNAT